MTPEACPLPHEAGEGYCPECGLLLSSVGSVDPASAPPCGVCGTRSDGGRYCEGCGREHQEPAGVPVPGSWHWSAVISTDRRLFEAMRGTERGFEFPDGTAWRIALDRPVIRIGRADGSGPSPELDLDGPSPDPGVSREHAELTRRVDGVWEVRDCGSRNGTWVGRTRLRAGQTVPLAGGERIRLGLWTRIELVRDRDDRSGAAVGVR